MGDEGGDENTDDAHRNPELSIDATLELLSHHERRHILSYFVDSSEDVATVEKLVEHILQYKTEQTGEVPNQDHILAELHHIHLPKLTDAGIIEYDPRSQQLRYWGDEQLEEWLECIERAAEQS